ncbi:thioredoxin domain-containing protein [Phthorimaea operculella]|nr:thioredoxin domain-containing protein [Phthorimaea operculella]
MTNVPPYRVLSYSGKKPWLVYFHSPRCFHCYEMYPDFAIAGINLRNSVHLGKVNCVSERGLCQHEQITSYPSLRLYLPRSRHQQFSSVITLPVRDHETLLKQIKPHLNKYDASLFDDDLGIRGGVHMKHDEF